MEEISEASSTASKVRHRSVVFDESGIDLLTSLIKNISDTNFSRNKNSIVSICGGSCTGKSTQIAWTLKNRIGRDTQVLSQDNYMFAAGDSAPDPTYRWDHPNLYNLAESANVMDQLRDGLSCTMPHNSIPRKPAGVMEINPSRIILFEGLYSSFDILIDHADFVIYVEMPLYTRIIRRLIRNMYERYRGVGPQQIFESFLNTPLKAHNDFVIRQRDRADVIVTAEYSFINTITRFKLTPVGNARMGYKRKEYYRFGLDNDVVFVVEKLCDGYHFLILHEDLVYLNFPISEDAFFKLLDLDLREM